MKGFRLTPKQEEDSMIVSVPVSNRHKEWSLWLKQLPQAIGKYERDGLAYANDPFAPTAWFPIPQAEATWERWELPTEAELAAWFLSHGTCSGDE